MAIYKSLIFISITFLLFLLVTPAKGQIRCHFEKDSIQTQAGQFFTNKLVIKNESAVGVTLIKKSKDTDALIPLPDTVRLQGTSSQTFFTKYLATKDQRISLLPITAIYALDKQLFNASFMVITPSIARLSLTSFTAINYLDPATHKVDLKLICTNTGNQALNFKLTIKSYPEGLICDNPIQNILLHPGDRQTITLSLRNTISARLSTDFKATILAIGLDDNVLTSYSTKVTQVGSDKQMSSGNNPYNALLNNSVALNFWNNNNNGSYLQASVNGLQALKDSSFVNYRLNLNHYFKPALGNEFYDSWVGYENKKFSFKIGSVNENLDFPMYGQGAQFNTKLNDRNSISALYVKRNYLIYSDLNSQPSSATIYALHYDLHEKQRQLGGANFIFSRDPVTGVQTLLTNGNWTVPMKGQQQLYLEAGISQESIPDSAASTGKYGGAFGINYSNSFNKWTVQSNNYYSSAYYGGIRRGVLLLSERLSRNFSRDWSGFLSYTANHNTPEYLFTSYYNSGATKNNTYALGISKQLENLNFTLRPYLFTQKLIQPNFISLTETSSLAWNSELSTIIQLYKQQIVLVSDYGWVNSDNPYLQNNTYSHWKLMASYSRNHLGLNAIIQHNPYYLTEEPNIWQQGAYRRYSLGPNVQLGTQDNRLRLSLSNYASFDNYVGRWYNAAQADFSSQLSPTWAVGGAVLLNTYEGLGRKSFLQTRLTLEKKFLQKNAPGNHRIQVTFFGDENANGNWDPGETALAGIIVQVNESTAISNNKGKISISNLSPKTYTLQIVDANKWSCPNSASSIDFKMNRNLKQVIPMIQTVLVEGQVIALTNKYTQQSPSLEGIRIVAKDGGIERQSTLTDDKGYFQFYLPKKTYSVSLNAEGLNFSIPENSVQKVLVAETGMPKIIFKIIDQSRKVDIQQF